MISPRIHITPQDIRHAIGIQVGNICNLHCCRTAAEIFVLDHRQAVHLGCDISTRADVTPDQIRHTVSIQVSQVHNLQGRAAAAEIPGLAEIQTIHQRTQAASGLNMAPQDIGHAIGIEVCKTCNLQSCSAAAKPLILDHGQAIHQRSQIRPGFDITPYQVCFTIGIEICQSHDLQSQTAAAKAFDLYEGLAVHNGTQIGPRADITPQNIRFAVTVEIGRPHPQKIGLLIILPAQNRITAHERHLPVVIRPNGCFSNKIPVGRQKSRKCFHLERRFFRSAGADCPAGSLSIPEAMIDKTAVVESHQTANIIVYSVDRTNGVTARNDAIIGTHQAADLIRPSHGTGCITGRQHSIVAPDQPAGTGIGIGCPHGGTGCITGCKHTIQIIPDQTADIAKTLDGAVRITGADCTVITPARQAANTAYAADRTGRIACRYSTGFIISNKAADIVRSIDGSGRITVMNRAGILTRQPANIIVAINRTGHIAVSQRAKVLTRQSSDVLTAGGELHIFQTEIPNGGILNKAKQANIIHGYHGGIGQVVDSIAIAIKGASEGGINIPYNTILCALITRHIQVGFEDKTTSPVA